MSRAVALVPDVALGKAWKADESGNLIFRKTARNFNPPAAMCGKVCVAEVEEIVPRGSIDPDMIHLPGIGPFVHIMYRGNPIRPNMITSLGSATRMLEWHVLRRDDIPPDVRSDIVAVCEQWHSPPMRGYVDLDIDSKIRIGKMVRDHAERLLAVQTR